MQLAAGSDNLFRSNSSVFRERVLGQLGQRDTWDKWDMDRDGAKLRITNSAPCVLCIPWWRDFRVTPVRRGFSTRGFAARESAAPPRSGLLRLLSQKPAERCFSTKYRSEVSMLK